MRNVGGSIGVSSLVTVLARRSQAHQTILVTHYTPYDHAFTQARHHLLHSVLPNGNPLQGLRLMYGLLLKQAALLSYVDIFMWSALLGLFCTFLTLALKKAKARGPVMMH
jgi:DHA2 family multidrug resistance protein